MSTHCSVWAGGGGTESPVHPLSGPWRVGGRGEDGRGEEAVLVHLGNVSAVPSLQAAGRGAPLLTYQLKTPP